MTHRLEDMWVEVSKKLADGQPASQMMDGITEVPVAAVPVPEERSRPATLEDLLCQAEGYGQHSAEYYEKMMHPIPTAPVVNRVEFILHLCRGRAVLDVGCSGPLHAEIVKIAKVVYGIDREPQESENFYQIDLDRAVHLPSVGGIELVVAGEVIEHLGNAGHFLELIREYNCPVVLTTPNAFSDAGRQSVRHGIENVNREHVAWYSYHTLKTLVERYGYTVMQFAWYNGKPGTAEGLVFVIE